MIDICNKRQKLTDICNKRQKCEYMDRFNDGCGFDKWTEKRSNNMDYDFAIDPN